MLSKYFNKEKDKLITLIREDDQSAIQFVQKIIDVINSIHDRELDFRKQSQGELFLSATNYDAETAGGNFESRYTDEQLEIRKKRSKLLENLANEPSEVVVEYITEILNDLSIYKHYRDIDNLGDLLK